MNRASLGRTLGRIRRIRGLSREACEAELRVPAGTLLASEDSGLLTESLIRALARMHGLDAELLEEGQVRPVAGIQGATVFLLHSGNQDFAARDLASLEDGLLAGRILARSLACRPALAIRGAFAPVAVAGPESRHAAQQGHRLANRVRRVLGLGAGRLGDLGELLVRHLGVAVFVPEFPSEAVEAASIVDSNRLAACTMVSARIAQPDHPRMRVLLAHELCHVLFDPARPGTVRLSVHQGGRNTALEESRAKGFAAELLLPRSGLVELLGEPNNASAEHEARSLVQRARTHFGTTSEVAVWHLKNHEFIDWDIAEQLVEEPVAAQVEVHTSLPAKGAFPDDAPPAPPHTELSVALAGAVTKAAPAIHEDAARQLLQEAEGAVDEFEATDTLVLELDRHLSASNTELLARVLALADCAKLRPSVLGGLLLLSKAAASKIPDAARDFSERALKSLAGVLAPQEFAAVRKQFE